MKYAMTNPCAKCPFRHDIPGYLMAERAEEIAETLTTYQGVFPCHETVDYKGADDEEGNGVVKDDSQHCAGAMIMLEHMEMPNQMMRIAERLGMYDATKLNMWAPVFDDAEAFIEHHSSSFRKRASG